MRMLSSDCGFSLIELLIAMLVMVVGLMGLLKSVEVATVQNLQNQMRDEAIQVTERQLSLWRSVPFASISTCLTNGTQSTCSATPPTYQYTPVPVPSQLRGVNRTYMVTRSTIAAPDGSAVDLGVRVKWSFKNMSTAHEVHTVRSST